MVGGIGPVNDELMELLYNKDNSYESGHDMTKAMQEWKYQCHRQ